MGVGSYFSIKAILTDPGKYPAAVAFINKYLGTTILNDSNGISSSDIIEYEYSTSVIVKAGEDILDNNFPCMLYKDILDNPILFRLDGRIEHLARGYLNDVEGVYHITTNGNLIIHRMFM